MLLPMINISVLDPTGNVHRMLDPTELDPRRRTGNVMCVCQLLWMEMFWPVPMKIKDLPIHCKVVAQEPPVSIFLKKSLLIT